MDLWVVFLTGLTVGGFSCMAVQGGLLASTIASREEIDRTKVNLADHSSAVGIFLFSKILSHILLGFLLGLFGQAVALTDTARILLQVFAGIYMVVIAMYLLNVHPIFKYAVIQPPRFLTRLVRNQAKSRNLFAPALLGVFTIFIPCGTTLAMSALAISSQNPITGALIMGLFILGTSPVFFGLGFLTALFSEKYQSKFLKFAGVVVLILGIMSINGGMVALGSPLTIQNIASLSPIQFGNDGEEVSNKDITATVVDGVQVASIEILSSGYSPEYIRVRKDQPVRINLSSKGVYSCASAFRIPALGYKKNLKPNDKAVVEFTPTARGKIAYTCSMGMYTGIIEVI